MLARSNLRHAVRKAYLLAAGAVVITGAASALGALYAASATPTRTSVNTSPLQISNGFVRDAALVSDQFGWQLGDDSLDVTTDGGEDWSSVTPTGVQASDIRSVDFVDAQTGWLLTSVDGGAGTQLVVYRTSDGGEHWYPYDVATPSPVYADAEAGPAYFDFIDNSNGWLNVQLATSAAFSHSVLFRTSDGGDSWETVAYPVAGQVAFLNRDDGWLAGGLGNSLYSTTDGGSTWTVSAPSGSGTGTQGSFAYSLTTGGSSIGLTASAANSDQAQTYRLSDGNSWSLEQTTTDGPTQGPDPTVGPIASMGIQSLATFVGNQTLAIAGVSPTSSREVHTNLPQGEVVALSFIDETNGWAVVADSSCSGFKTDCSESSTVYATSDGGSTWSDLR